MIRTERRREVGPIAVSYTHLMWLEMNGDVPARTSVVEAYMADEAYAEYPLSLIHI